MAKCKALTGSAVKGLTGNLPAVIRRRAASWRGCVSRIQSYKINADFFSTKNVIESRRSPIGQYTVHQQFEQLDDSVQSLCVCASVRPSVCQSVCQPPAFLPSQALVLCIERWSAALIRDGINVTIAKVR